MHARIRALELELIAPATRANAERLRQLLHPDFVEIGRSGTRWTRDAIIKSLLAHPRSEAPDVDEWEFSDIDDQVVLVTYRSRDCGRTSRHSSLWDVAGTSPVLRFHQGTVVPG